jgi:VIT1/CCC1 family predicted Fe2+/Mn2+ transporter
MAMIDHSVRVGISFGMTSGVITTLGLLVGLSSGTDSRAAVVGGILTIAVADSLSDALGIHVAEESEGVHSRRQIWTSTFATFSSKLLMALSFVVPVLLLDLQAATAVALVWGAVALTALSALLARVRRERAFPVVAEHLAVAAIVVVAAHLIGRWIADVVT